MARKTILLLIIMIAIAHIAFCATDQLQIGSQVIYLNDSAGTDGTSGTFAPYIQDYAIKTKTIITEQEIDFFSQAGIEINDYLGGTTYIAKSNNMQLAIAQKDGMITAYYPLDISHKAPVALTASTKKELNVIILPYSEESLPFLVAKLENMGAKNVRASQTAVLANIKNAMLGTLLSFKEVKWVEENLPREISNNYAQGLTGVTSAKGKNYFGLGQIISISDTGIDTGNPDTMHADLKGKTYAIFSLGRENDSSDPHGHGTHVAGTVVGTGEKSSGAITGFAPNAGIYFQSVMDEYGGLGGIPIDIYDMFNQTYAQGARIFSSSWGSAAQGAYTFDSQSADWFAYENPDAIIIFAAGNDGTAGSVNSPCTAKNIICVGASENARTNFNPDKIAPYSSKGPTKDGRIKPDFVAPGSMLLSTKSSVSNAAFWGNYDQYYLFSGGTSMATPALAGTAAILREYIVTNSNVSSPSSAVMRATLTALARKIDGAITYAPDFSQGWGKPDIKPIFENTKTLQIYSSKNAGGTGIGQEETYTLDMNNSGELSVALAWTDRPSSTLANTTLINDLDVWITDSSGTIYYPNGKTGPDRLNTIEKIVISNAQGNYTLTVKYQNGTDAFVNYGLVIAADSFSAGSDGILTFAPRQYYIGDSGTHISSITKAANRTNSGNATLVFIAGGNANCSFGSAVMTSPDKKPVQTANNCRMIGPYYECNFENLENGDYFADVMCVKNGQTASFGTDFSIYNGILNYTISAKNGIYTNNSSVKVMAMPAGIGLKCAFGETPDIQILPSMDDAAYMELLDAEGEKIIFGKCQDGYGNLGNMQNTTVIIDKTAPQVYAGLASGGTMTQPNKARIIADSIDNFGIANCTAYEAGIENSTGLVFFQSTEENITRNITVDFEMALAGHVGAGSINLACSDFAGNIGNVFTLNFTFDNSTPTISGFSMLENKAYARTGQNISLLISAINATYCQIYLDSVISNKTYPANTASAYSMPETGSGRHEISAMCFNKNGRPSESRSLSVIVDNSPPEITILSPLGEVFTSIPKLEFDMTDDYSDKTTCNITADYGSSRITIFGKLPIASDIPQIANGNHYGKVTCADEAGNSNSKNFSFTFNPLAPHILLKTGARHIGSPNALVNLELGQGATLKKIELDGVLVNTGNITSEIDLAGLQTGYHNVSALAQTPFGEMTSTLIIYVDTTVPEIIAINAPAAHPENTLQISANVTPYSIVTLNQPTGMQTVSRSGPAGITYFNITLPVPGSNSFTVQITSATGINGTQTGFTVEYNTTIPEPPKFTGFPNITRAANVTFKMMSADATSIKYWTNAFSSKTTIYGANTFNASIRLVEGPNTIYAIGYSAKNISSNISSTSLICDSTGPIISMVYPQDNGYINDKKPKIIINVSDAYAGCDMQTAQFEINGILVDAVANQTACTIEYMPQSELSEGQFEIRANVSDLLGNSAAKVFKFNTLFTPPKQPRAVLTFNSTHAILDWSEDNQTSMEKYDIYYSLNQINDITGKQPLATINGSEKRFSKKLGNDGPEIHFGIVAYDMAQNPSAFENEIYGDSPIYVAPEPVGYSTPSKLKIDTVIEKNRMRFGSGEITITRTFSSTSTSTTAIFVVENTGNISFSNVIFALTVPNRYAGASGGMRYLTEPETVEITGAGAKPKWTISKLGIGEKIETGIFLTPKLTDTKAISEEVSIKQATVTGITPSTPAESGAQEQTGGQTSKNPFNPKGEQIPQQSGNSQIEKSPEVSPGRINLEISMPSVQARQIISIANYVPVLLLGALLSAIMVWTAYNRLYPEDYPKKKDPFDFD